jgi:hypothetical protein
VQHYLHFYSIEEVFKEGLRYTIIKAILRYSNSISYRCIIVPLSILLSLYYLLLVVYFLSFLYLPLLGLAYNTLLLKKACSTFRV